MELSLPNTAEYYNSKFPVSEGSGSQDPMGFEEKEEDPLAARKIVDKRDDPITYNKEYGQIYAEIENISRKYTSVKEALLSNDHNLHADTSTNIFEWKHPCNDKMKELMDSNESYKIDHVSNSVMNELFPIPTSFQPEETDKNGNAFSNIDLTAINTFIENARKGIIPRESLTETISRGIVSPDDTSMKELNICPNDNLEAGTQSSVEKMNESLDIYLEPKQTQPSVENANPVQQATPLETMQSNPEALKNIMGKIDPSKNVESNMFLKIPTTLQSNIGNNICNNNKNNNNSSNNNNINDSNNSFTINQRLRNLFEEKRIVEQDAFTYWKSKHRNLVIGEYPDASGAEIEQHLCDIWTKLPDKYRLKYFNRAARQLKSNRCQFKTVFKKDMPTKPRQNQQKQQQQQKPKIGKPKSIRTDLLAESSLDCNPTFSKSVNGDSAANEAGLFPDEFSEYNNGHSIDFSNAIKETMTYYSPDKNWKRKLSKRKYEDARSTKSTTGFTQDLMINGGVDDLGVSLIPEDLESLASIDFTDLDAYLSTNKELFFDDDFSLDEDNSTNDEMLIDNKQGSAKRETRVNKLKTRKKRKKKDDSRLMSISYKMPRFRFQETTRTEEITTDKINKVTSGKKGPNQKQMPSIEHCDHNYDTKHSDANQSLSDLMTVDLEHFMKIDDDSLLTNKDFETYLTADDIDLRCMDSFDDFEIDQEDNKKYENAVSKRKLKSGPTKARRKKSRTSTTRKKENNKTDSSSDSINNRGSNRGRNGRSATTEEMSAHHGKITEGGQKEETKRENSNGKIVEKRSRKSTADPGGKDSKKRSEPSKRKEPSKRNESSKRKEPQKNEDPLKRKVPPKSKDPPERNQISKRSEKITRKSVKNDEEKINERLNLESNRDKSQNVTTETVKGTRRGRSKNYNIITDFISEIDNAENSNNPNIIKSNDKESSMDQGAINSEIDKDKEEGVESDIDTTQNEEEKNIEINAGKNTKINTEIEDDSKTDRFENTNDDDSAKNEIKDELNKEDNKKAPKRKKQRKAIRFSKKKRSYKPKLTLALATILEEDSSDFNTRGDSEEVEREEEVSKATDVNEVGNESENCEEEKVHEAKGGGESFNDMSSVDSNSKSDNNMSEVVEKVIATEEELEHEMEKQKISENKDVGSTSEPNNHNDEYPPALERKTSETEEHRSDEKEVLMRRKSGRCRKNVLDESKLKNTSYVDEETTFKKQDEKTLQEKEKDKISEKSTLKRKRSKHDLVQQKNNPKSKKSVEITKSSRRPKSQNANEKATKKPQKRRNKNENSIDIELKAEIIAKSKSVRKTKTKKRRILKEN